VLVCADECYGISLFVKMQLNSGTFTSDILLIGAFPG